MNQNELNREIARATGESVATIAALGFSVLVEPPPLVIVDRRTRLRDLVRRQSRGHRARIRKSPGAGSSAAVAGRSRSAAFLPEWHGRIVPMPNIRRLTFDKWGA